MVASARSARGLPGCTPSTQRWPWGHRAPPACVAQSTRFLTKKGSLVKGSSCGGATASAEETP